MKTTAYSNPFFVEQDKLGEGGMGVVLRVLDSKLERVVAVKKLRAELADDRDQARRFLAEARTTGQLQHPHIPAVYELGQDERGHPYIALRLVEGESLGRLIDRLRNGDSKLHADYPWSARLQLFLKVCDAVEYAHAHNYLHRDLKPENIMLGEYGEVYVMDWGLARPLDYRNAPDEDGTFTGTPEFASPEQIAGGELKPASDIYSLGVVLYELLTLKLPFGDKDLSRLLTSVFNEKAVPPENLSHPIQGRVPRELSLIVCKALEKEPEKRYATVAELKSDLMAFLANEARPVCPHTAMKSWLFKLNRFIDNHPYAGALTVYGYLSLPFLLGLGWLLTAFKIL